MKSNLSNMAYEYIANAIGSGEIATGSILSEQSLANNLKISRTPIREAVRRLKYEGIVEQVPRYGTIVCHPDRNRLKELYELREALECYAVERSAEQISPQALEEVKGLVEELHSLVKSLRISGKAALEGEELRHFLEVDMFFHLSLLEAAQNQTILKAVTDSRALTGIFGVRREVHDLSVLEGSYLRHSEVFEAVKAGNGRLARERLSLHIRESRQKALAHFDEIRAPQKNDHLHQIILAAASRSVHAVSP